MFAGLSYPFPQWFLQCWNYSTRNHFGTKKLFFQWKRYFFWDDSTNRNHRILRLPQNFQLSTFISKFFFSIRFSLCQICFWEEFSAYFWWYRVKSLKLLNQSNPYFLAHFSLLIYNIMTYTSNLELFVSFSIITKNKV